MEEKLVYKAGYQGNCSQCGISYSAIILLKASNRQRQSPPPYMEVACKHVARSALDRDLSSTNTVYLAFMGRDDEGPAQEMLA